VSTRSGAAWRQPGKAEVDDPGRPTASTTMLAPAASGARFLPGAGRPPVSQFLSIEPMRGTGSWPRSCRSAGHGQQRGPVTSLDHLADGGHGPRPGQP
jgi:hypothetical protein